MDDVDLVTMQTRAVKELLGASDDDKLLETSRSLANTLRCVSEHEGLWSLLVLGSRAPVDAGQLALLVSLDWPTILTGVGFRPPPPSDAVAEELAFWASSSNASYDPTRWWEVRDRLVWLADQLDSDASSPAVSTERKWWRRLRDKAAYGVSALRRVSVATMLTNAATDPVKFVGVHAMGALIGFSTFGPVGAALGAAVGGLLAASITELNKAFAAESKERKEEPLTELLDAQALQRAVAAQRSVDLQLIQTMVEGMETEKDGGGMEGVRDKMLELIDGVRRWGATVGAELANGWAFVAAHAAQRGLAFIDTAVQSLHRLRAALSSIEEALRRTSNPAVRFEIDEADAAVLGVVDAVTALRGYLIGQGLSPHPA